MAERRFYDPDELKCPRCQRPYVMAYNFLMHVRKKHPATFADLKRAGLYEPDMTELESRRITA